MPTVAVTLKTMFFEYPWPLVIAIWATSLFLFYLARKRADKRLFQSAVTAFIVGFVPIALSYTVTTDAEIVRKRTKQLLQATAPLHMDKLNTFLEQYASIVGPKNQNWISYKDLQTILPTVQRNTQYTSHQVIVTRTEVLPGNMIATFLKLRTKIKNGMTIKSDWTLLWKEAPDGEWRVNQIRFDKLQNHEPVEGIWLR